MFLLGNRATLLSEKILGDSIPCCHMVSSHDIGNRSHDTFDAPPYWLAAGIFWYIEPNFSQIKMADQPSYVAFFGVMGATSAMVFSGEYVVVV